MKMNQNDEEFPEFLEELEEFSEEEEESEQPFKNLPEKTTVDLDSINIVQGHRIHTVMTLDLIQSGFRQFCSYPDQVRKNLKEKIPGDLPIHYYIGIIEANRQALDYLLPVISPGLFMENMGRVNCRVFFIVRQRPLEEQWEFINSINREK